MKNERTGRKLFPPCPFSPCSGAKAGKKKTAFRSGILPGKGAKAKAAPEGKLPKQLWLYVLGEVLLRQTISTGGATEAVRLFPSKSTVMRQPSEISPERMALAMSVSTWEEIYLFIGLAP